jgi:hypothetical protein
MKKNWFITQVAVGVLVAAICGRAAEPAHLPAPAPGLDALGYPTNSLIALELGRADATSDVSKGVLRVPMFGLPPEWSSDFNRILAEKYKVERYGLGGCLVSESLTEYARGYSEISRHAIEQKFGANFFNEVQAEAKQAYEQKIRDTATAKRIYRVKAGDTFWDIARQHRVAVSSLVAANPGVKPERLQINYSLNLPTAARP